VIPKMSPRLIPSDASQVPSPSSLPKTEVRGPMAQLLHALNQPLTGLQCSMEVALARPCTPEQYVQGLRQGLELTDRMRALVEAIREVSDVEEEKTQEPETAELKTVLREILADLAPVAEVQKVHIMLDDFAASSLAVKAGRRRLATVVFRLLESALSLAAQGSTLRIETGVTSAGGWIRIRWHAGPPTPEFSRPELGLLVAQAGWELAGAEWERQRTENLETVTVRLPRISASSRNSQSSLS
jgi:signal transduction histidine kinase